MRNKLIEIYKTMPRSLVYHDAQILSSYNEYKICENPEERDILRLVTVQLVFQDLKLIIHRMRKKGALLNIKNDDAIDLVSKSFLQWGKRLIKFDNIISSMYDVTDIVKYILVYEEEAEESESELL